MSAAKKYPNIYNIPSGIAFSCALAAQLIAETKSAPERLAAYRLILPTRRACRVLQNEFIRLSEGKSIVLPRLQALGDVDEEELSLALIGQMPQEFLEIPPALPSLRRLALLAQAILRIPGYAHNFDHTLRLAKPLGQLMDHAYTEGLSLKDLRGLVVDSDLARHWQITVTFMEALATQWEKILEIEGVIDAADRRNRLMMQLARHWESSPPSDPVIIAGTTGSIPATMELLRVVACLPEGRIVLPGLDQEMDEESWEALEDTHPQYGLYQLLKSMKVERERVRLWPGVNPQIAWPRRVLASEIMRPAKTSHRWATGFSQDEAKKTAITTALKDLRILHCSNEREEAQAIGILLREALETPGRRVAVVTPSRTLATRITAACQRWGINLDDSAGKSLNQTRAGIFLLLCIQAMADGYSPVSFLSLLKHPLCGIQNVNELDLLLRGPKPRQGQEGLQERIPDDLIQSIEPLMKRFMRGSPSLNTYDFSEILDAHLQLAEDLAGPAGALWQGEDGEAAAVFFAQCREIAALFPPLSLASYAAVIGDLMKTVTVRPAYGAHPRLQILGQLEARMMDADLVILAGLNEKSWPPEAGHDPWMSRPMRAKFGLPSPERAVGLAAHDFVQGFCLKDVVITRAAKNEDGSPAVPARWLQRLSTILLAAGIDPRSVASSPALHWAYKLDRSNSLTPVKRPAPKPPLDARPRRLSVTQIEMWLQDPYGIYARHILRLKPLDELEKPVDAAEKGQLLHEILRNFVQAYPAAIPPEAKEALIKFAFAALEKRSDNHDLWSFWRRRFEKLAEGLIAHEREWRRCALPQALEAAGEIEIKLPSGLFSLHVRADRIDRMGRQAVIIDYKSGGSFSAKGMRQGRHPQLPLEALILSYNGFAELKALEPASLQYWKLTGGPKPLEIIKEEKDIKGLLAETEEGLRKLVGIYDNANIPYYSLPRSDFAPRFNDYLHLARVHEWSAQGDEDMLEAS